MKNETQYLDAGKMLQDLSGKLKDDTTSAIYLCELYKKTICIMLTAFNAKGFVVSEVASDEYEQEVPNLNVFASDDGSIRVWLDED
jgi:hypothetical protein